MYSLITKDRIVVQKYGGTSVGNEERIHSVARRIAEQVRGGWKKIAVVVSAMSGETNRLVNLITRVNPDASAEHYDMTVAAGEQISVALLAAAIEAEGIEAQPLLAFQTGIFTDGSHSRARILNIQTQKIRACWEQGNIPVVAGFQGVTSELALTTLGRGGSDISAVALAVELGAAFCEINTDVDGVFTADPRWVDGARLIEKLDYDSALELAALGSKVLHSRCVELGAKHLMPIVVRNSFLSSDARRTTIMSFDQKDALEAPVVSGITVDQNIAKVTIRNLPRDSKAMSGIFSAVAQQGVNVDIIVQNKQRTESNVRLGFTIARSDLKRSLQIIEALKDKPLFKEIEVNATEDLAKVSIVGLGMRSYAGVASRVFSILSEQDIDIGMISTSEIKISCVVPQGDSERAAQLLHDDFFKRVVKRQRESTETLRSQPQPSA